MSVRLVNAWHNGDPYDHSPIDDLGIFYDLVHLQYHGVKPLIFERHSVASIVAHRPANEFRGIVFRPLETLFHLLVSDWQRILPPMRRAVLSLLQFTPRSNEALQLSRNSSLKDPITCQDSYDSFILPT